MHIVSVDSKKKGKWSKGSLPGGISKNVNAVDITSSNVCEDVTSDKLMQNVNVAALNAQAPGKHRCPLD